MGAIEDVLSRTPPPVLYHYTSFNGLLGIVTSKSIWATNIHYLNDSKEFAHAREITLGLINLRQSSGLTADINELFDKVKQALDSIEKINICVFSLSENGDLLSQWRGYCPDAKGCSIGFDSTKLISLTKTQDFFLAPCLYDSVGQRRIIDQILDEIISLFSQPNGDPLDKRHLDCQSFFARKFLTIGPIIKHHSFSEEKEWRLISYPKDSTDPLWGYRAGKSMIIPHFVFKLGSAVDENPLIQIIVGPTSQQSLTMSAITNLLSTNKIKYRSISLSSIPYREC